MPSGPYISGIAFRIGTPQPIDALSGKAGASDESLAQLRSNGLVHFCESPESLAEMCVGAARETLSLTAVEPGDVGTVVIAGSNSDAIISDEDETALFAALNEAGFARARIVGLSLLSCSASADALVVASALANSQGRSAPALVIVFGQRKKMSRLGPQGNLVFSDGAVSCLLRAREGDFELCASDSITDTLLGMLGRAGSLQHLQGGAREINRLSAELCARCGVSPEKLRAFFGINAGRAQLQIMAQAAGVPLHLAYQGDVARFGHLHSCDGLIGLRNYAQANRLEDGDMFLMMSWSPHVVCGSIVRYVGHG